jgi:hypothetical protein
MRKPVALVAVLAVAGALAAVMALSAFAGPRAPTAVIDGWPIGAHKGICADAVCAEMTRLGLAALDERYPTHAAVLSSTLYGLGACVDPSTTYTAQPVSGGARTWDVLVVALADGAVHAFGVNGRAADTAPSVAHPLDAPYCESVTSGRAP